MQSASSPSVRPPTKKIDLLGEDVADNPVHEAILGVS